MATIKEFEDLIIWKDARELVKIIYFQLNNSKDFGFRDQIQRASVSIMNNIAEGFERESSKEFKRFLYIAKASYGEVRSMLYIASDLQIMNEQTIQIQHQLCRKISVGISKMIKYLNTKTN